MEKCEYLFAEVAREPERSFKMLDHRRPLLRAIQHSLLPLTLRASVLRSHLTTHRSRSGAADIQPVQRGFRYSKRPRTLFTGGR